jgi:hypothetical protein
VPYSLMTAPVGASMESALDRCFSAKESLVVGCAEWKPAFWVIVNHRLWIYRSKKDYDPTDYLVVSGADLGRYRCTALVCSTRSFCMRHQRLSIMPQ